MVRSAGNLAEVSKRNIWRKFKRCHFNKTKKLITSSELSPQSSSPSHLSDAGIHKLKVLHWNSLGPHVFWTEINIFFRHFEVHKKYKFHSLKQGHSYLRGRYHFWKVLCHWGKSISYLSKLNRRDTGTNIFRRVNRSTDDCNYGYWSRRSFLLEQNGHKPEKYKFERFTKKIWENFR